MNGILAVSRAFGDRNMKGAINAEPEVRERSLDRQDEYLVLATDGLWDVMTSQEACDIVWSCAPKIGPQVGGYELVGRRLGFLFGRPGR